MGIRKAAIVWQMYRLAYRSVVRLHPRVFRDQFGEGMLWIFEDAAKTHGALRLLGDGMFSLLRQWVLRPRPSQVVVAEAVPAILHEAGTLTWEHISVSHPRLPAGRWMQGGLMSLALLTGVCMGITQVPKRALVASFAIDSDSAFRARGFLPSNSEDRGTDSGQGGGYISGVYAAMKPQDLSARQRRQQQLAVQVAAGAQIIPGATSLAVESQGLVPEVPKTPAGEQFSTWLRAFNSGERTRIEEVRKLFKNPPGPSIDGDMAFRRTTGGFDLRKIDQSSDTQMSGLVQERGSDQFARFEVTVEKNAPHLITEWKLDAIPTPAQFAVGRMSEPLAVEAAKARIDELAKDERFSGAVLVTKNGKPILSEVYGLADRDKKIPNSLSTKFRIGSMNKMFTAVSVLQLVQAGKIKLSEPFGKYVSDYPNKDAASKVNIEQLLTHTGGTGDIFGPEFAQHRKDLRSLQDYVNLYGKRALEFAPGSRWEYSNYGFLLLGVVVERVSGKSYYDYVRENVYAPAGMSSTASLPEDENVPDRSIGYTSFGGQAIHPNTDTLPYRGTSAGGGYSTVEDLQRFASALMNHKLLSAEYTDLLTTGKVATPRGGKYAFGFFDDGADSGARHFGHGGGAPGMNGDLQIYPQNGYVIAVLSNLDPPAASRVSEFIASRLPKN